MCTICVHISELHCVVFSEIKYSKYTIAFGYLFLILFLSFEVTRSGAEATLDVGLWFLYFHSSSSYLLSFFVYMLFVFLFSLCPPLFLPAVRRLSPCREKYFYLQSENLLLAGRNIFITLEQRLWIVPNFAIEPIISFLILLVLSVLHEWILHIIFAAETNRSPPLPSGFSPSMGRAFRMNLYYRDACISSP